MKAMMVLLFVTACSGNATTSPAPGGDGTCSGTVSGAVTASFSTCVVTTTGTTATVITVNSPTDGPSGGLPATTPSGANFGFIMSDALSDKLSAKTYALSDSDVESISGGGLTLDNGSTITTYSATKTSAGGVTPAGGSATFSISKIASEAVGSFTLTGTFDGVLTNVQGSDTVTVHLQFSM